MSQLYAYGTLRRTLQIPGKPKSLFSYLVPVKQTTVKGKLYNLGWYPGIKLGGDSIVVCDVFDVPDEMWPILDEYEGFRRDDLSSSLYIRAPIMENAYIYEYNHNVKEDALISSGDWFDL